jgi:hypothetical protein
MKFDMRMRNINICTKRVLLVFFFSLSLSFSLVLFKCSLLPINKIVDNVSHKEIVRNSYLFTTILGYSWDMSDRTWDVICRNDLRLDSTCRFFFVRQTTNNMSKYLSNILTIAIVLVQCTFIYSQLSNDIQRMKTA